MGGRYGVAADCGNDALWKNKDVIELFNLVEEGTPILILKY